MNHVRWGIMGVAKIATEKVIPGMKRASLVEVVGIASRTADKARQAAARLGLPSSYGSYDELLADERIDAVYIPLPNHLHVEWSIRSLRAGKHVLCEKPIGLSVAEAEELAAAGGEHPRLKLMEAFMYRHHPQWVAARRMVNEGKIGQLRTIQTLFSYFNRNPLDVRNQAQIGGGGVMDIGCYPISLSRFLFAAEPMRVMAHIEYDPEFRTDRLASAVLEFAKGTGTFTCGTQIAPYQRVHIVGTQGRIEIEIPFNAPPDHPCRLWHQHASGTQEIVFDVCDQYGIQAELFSRAVIDGTPVPTPIDDSVANMRVIEALFRSGETGSWEGVR